MLSSSFLLASKVLPPEEGEHFQIVSGNLS